MEWLCYFAFHAGKGVIEYALNTNYIAAVKHQKSYLGLCFTSDEALGATRWHPHVVFTFDSVRCLVVKLVVDGIASKCAYRSLVALVRATEPAVFRWHHIEKVAAGRLTVASVV